MNNYINTVTDAVNKAIDNLKFNNDVPKLYQPVIYTLSGKGKRLRPVLMILAYSLYRDDYQRIMNNAIAMEVYHNFTLLHDDVMDNADVRRGKPCVHIKWNENTAILSGDAMLILAYKLMTQDFVSGTCRINPNVFAKVLDTFNDATLGVCEGQQFDMDFENSDFVSEYQYMNMIRLKTSLLLACSLKIGALLAEADDNDAQMLYDFGEKLGLAFQLQDDLLDVYGDPKVFGKNTGGDITENKKTYMLIKTFELADDKQKEIMNHWISLKKFDKQEKINAVKQIYEQVNIKQLCQQKIQCLFDEALNMLDTISPDDEKKIHLKKFALSLMDRNV